MSIATGHRRTVRRPTRPKIDRVTRAWIRNAADERAADRGARMLLSRVTNVERTGVIDFIEDHLRLYEGEWAGQPVRLMKWQKDFLTRVFGWVEWSKDRNRWVRRFRIASLWIPKKNGKSPTAAMIGLYLMCGQQDGEQKVFSAAHDGQQAMIVHRHAMRMIELSPVLSQCCTVNKGTGYIHYQADGSSYRPLACDNKKGQEGLNGSVIIDETHVVSAELAATLEFMGASRAQSLRLEISTAGSDPECYGRKQYEYGRDVNAGRVDDDHFYFDAYEAPQDADDEQCASPKVWKAANPSWGVTIFADEFADSWRRAQRSLSDLGTFKKYRLNIWQRAANPFLRWDDWVRCGRDYTLADFAGQPCWAGLDLSLANDMTALVLMFRDPDEAGRWYQWPFLWLPQEKIESSQHLASFQEWAAAGHLQACEGKTINQAQVRAKIAEIAGQHELRMLMYDQAYASVLIEQLRQEVGIVAEPFKQTMLQFAGPTEQYERLVIDGKLHHPRNPVLDWQAGHVEVYRDANGNKRPIKPKTSQERKIDGIVAGIMALGRAIAAETEGSGSLTFW